VEVPTASEVGGSSGGPETEDHNQPDICRATRSSGTETLMKQGIVAFVNDVGSEMKKVSWPKKQQLQESTVVTIVTCLVITVFVFAVDWIFTQIFNFIF
jgi:preprotein translocase subunit SecE